MRWISDVEHARVRPALQPCRREVAGAADNGCLRIEAADLRARRWCKWFVLAYVALFVGGAGLSWYAKWRERVEFAKQVQASAHVIVGAEG